MGQMSMLGESDRLRGFSVEDALLAAVIKGERNAQSLRLRQFMGRVVEHTDKTTVRDGELDFGPRKEMSVEEAIRSAAREQYGISDESIAEAQMLIDKKEAQYADGRLSVGQDGVRDEAVYEMTRDLVSDAVGKDNVIEVSDAEAREMIGNKKTPVTGLPNRANEKQTSGSVLLSAKGDSSSNPNVPSEATAKIVNDTQSAKTNIKKFGNNDFKINTSSLPETFRGLGKLLKLETRGGSRYTILQTDGGHTVAIRLSNHAANGDNFKRDNADNNLSIVVERRRFDAKPSEIEFTEVTIPLSIFEMRANDVVKAIVNGVDDVLSDKPFTLDKSLGTVVVKGGNKRRPLTSSGGVVYGWTAGGKIYLNRDAMNPDAPIHEYTHLWDEMLRKRNPALWLRGKELLKRTSLWQEVLDDANYADIRADEDAVASEVHSRLTGREGAKLLAGILADGRIKPMERAGVLSQVKAWITDMYRELRGTFEKWSGRDLSKLSVEDFTRMTLRDLADGVNPRDYIVPERKATALNDGTLERPMANSAYEFEQMQKRAEKERGIVMPGLNEAEVRVVYVPRHDFDGSGKDALRAAEKWAKGNIAGIHQARDNRGEKFNYSISNDTIEKYVSRSATGKSENIGVHLAVLKKLPEIIGDSIEAEVHADYKKQDGLRTSGSEVNSLSLVHRFYAAVNMDGVPYRVKITMREHADSNMSTVAHSYEVTQIELLKAPSDNTISTVEPLAMTSNSSISVAKLLHGVEKSYDSGKKLLDESVKVSEMERPGANVGGGIEAEVDEHGVPFVKTEDGTTVFGEITEDSGLPVAPIKLSIGFQDNTTQKGYGLIHIEAKHGKQIREVGFKSVEEFVSYVAKNYDPNNIRVGKSREDGTGTYLIQVVDSHENTLYIELAKDGSYWSVNSGGVFRKGYANKKETVAKTEPQQPNNAVSSGSSLSKDEQSGTSSIEPNGEPTVSYRKDNNYASDKQENSAESLSYNLERRASDVYAMGVRMGVRVVVDRTLGSRGAYNPNTGEVRVNPDAHKSMADLERTMAHEIVGHKGIHSLLGKSFDKVCERVSHLVDSEADKALGSLFRNWGTMSRRERGAEYMAWLAEKGGENTNPGKWQRVCGYIRVAMRRMGFGFEVTDADVRYMLYVSAKRATKAGGGQPIRRPEL